MLIEYLQIMGVLKIMDILGTNTHKNKGDLENYGDPYFYGKKFHLGCVDHEVTRFLLQLKELGVL